MSPTAQALSAANKLRAKLLQMAFDAEGTAAEAELDEAFKMAEESVAAAKLAHREAREAYAQENPR